ncbi:MAG: hypothetical protein IK127_00500 [Clostridia bacterium]|nr:hypothetical protein [Clostridia bacterium]
MPKYVDPICYQLHFSCVADQSRESIIKDSFAQIVRDLKPIVLPYLCDGMMKSYCSSSGPNGYPDGYFHWIGSSLVPLSETTEKLDSLLAKLEDNDFHGFILDGGEIKNEFVRYATKVSSFSKFYDKWFAVHRNPTFTNDEFMESIPTITRFLNCPTNDLGDISVPITALRNCTPFELALYRADVASLRLMPKHLVCEIISPYGNETAPVFYYQMRIVIPRFLVQAEEKKKRIQQKWYQALLNLGGQYQVCFGTMGMDCPPGHFINRGNTWYDDQAHTFLHRRFFQNYITGYSWCTLINSSQVSLINKRTKEQETFDEITKMPNGNICYCASPDMNTLSGETAGKIHDYFRPCLPPVKLDFWRDMIPHSLRLGFSADEVEYCGSETCLFSVVHSLDTTR